MGLFSRSETLDAFGKAFGLIDGLTIGVSETAGLTAASYGHPYVMQLLGYYLVLHADEHTSAIPYTVSAQDVSTVIPQVVEAYEQRALRPMLDELTASEVTYLRAMAEVLNEHRIARTGDVAKALGKSTKQLSRPRDRLLREGIIIAPAHGQLAFNVPYLASYALKDPGQEDSVRRALEWRL